MSTNPRAPGAGWTSTRLPGVDRDQAFDAGKYAVRQIATSVVGSPADGTIESGWAEYEQRGGTGRIRDETLKYKNRMRRKVLLMVTATETGTLVQCQVRVQRLDTADHRLFSQQSSFDDRPDMTPIDQDAAVSTGQKEAWTDMPRDRAMERQALDMLKNKVLSPLQEQQTKS